MATAMKRQIKKVIWDWSELEAAVTEHRRLSKSTPVSERALTIAGRIHGPGAHFAQMNERTIAVAMPDNIILQHLHMQRGLQLEDTRLKTWVSVYPSAGGRTTYCIDDSVDGWFANNHLPMSAKDRRTRSQYASKQWFYGQSGVYQRGTGPYYPDAGPECANMTLDALAEAVHGSSGRTSEQWREAAISVAERVSKAVAPFRDVVLRYEPEGLGEDVRFQVGGYTRSRDDDSYEPSAELESRYGLLVRLKTPHRSGHREGWEMTPDFVVQVGGPVNSFEDGPQVLYGAVLAYPQGRRGCTQWRPHNENCSTGLDFALSKSPVRIIEAARQWAASKIYIPCA